MEVVPPVVGLPKPGILALAQAQGSNFSRNCSANVLTSCLVNSRAGRVPERDRKGDGMVGKSI